MRTDIHSIKNYDPADYEYVGSFDSQPPNPPFSSKYGFMQTSEFYDYLSGWKQVVAHYKKLLESKGESIHYLKDGCCDHCGTPIRYVCVYQHVPTGEYIAVGETCSHNDFGYSSRVKRDIDAIRKAIKAQEERAERAKAAGIFINEHPEVAVLINPEIRVRHAILQDLYEKLVKWGSLSEKQIAFTLKLITENSPEAIAEREKAQQAELAARLPIPQTSDRIKITAIILGFKEVENRFARSRWDKETILKMIIRDDRGFKLFGSIPTVAGITIDKGMKIQFEAKVEKSSDDPFFGFYKRPTKAVVLA